MPIHEHEQNSEDIEIKNLIIPNPTRIDRIETSIDNLKKLINDAAEDRGRFIAALASNDKKLSRIELIVLDTAVRMNRLDSGQVTLDQKNELLRKIQTLEEEINKTQRNSAHDLEATENRLRMSQQEAAEKIAKAEAKAAADEVRLEHAKEALAEVKEDKRWLNRFLADKGVMIVMAVVGAISALAVQYALGHH